jgi:2'-5' RNA ligase
MSQLSLFRERKETIGNAVYEYFFLISPDWTIKKVVKEMKNKLNKEIGIEKRDLVSVPHISLFKRRSSSPTIDTLPYAGALSKTPAFEIHIDGFGAFSQYNHKKTLYLKVKEHEAIGNIFYNLLESQGDKKKPDFTPHITIARNINDVDRISDLSEYDFKGEFYCDKITVLRKAIYRNDIPLGTFEYYDEIHLLKNTNAFFG